MTAAIRKRRGIAAAFSAFICASAMLAGCSGQAAQTTAAQTTAAPASSTQTDADDSLQKVLDNGKLILGLDATFVPMGYTDENDNIVGFDIDVARAACEKLGVSLVLEPINWETKEEDLNLGKIDCIWNGLSSSPSRAEAMTLSAPYMVNDMIFVVMNNSGYKSINELEGKNVAVQNGSTAQEILEGSDIGKKVSSIAAIATNVEALQQMELGIVEGVFVDSVVANYLITSTGKDYRILPETIGEQEQYVIGFRKSDKTLCAKVEEVLKDMKSDGSLGEISKKWFGSDVTTIG